MWMNIGPKAMTLMVPPLMVASALLSSSAAWAEHPAAFDDAIAGTPVAPLLQAHAHNDYVHERPLYDALNRGFCSVEADIFLVEGELLVGHERAELRPGRTLESLYLEPLLRRVRKSGGTVFSEGVPFILGMFPPSFLRVPFLRVFPSSGDVSSLLPVPPSHSSCMFENTQCR